MLSNKDPEKARHYLGLLEAARCNGRWHEIPELVRKIGKHAPERQCLLLTAQTEHRVATHDSNQPSTSTSSNPTDLTQLGHPLQLAIEKEKTYPEDQFQAQVCLAWLHSALDEPARVLMRLSKNEVVQAIERFTNNVPPAGRWTHVCLVKCICLRGLALERQDDITEAVHVYDSLLPYLSKTRLTLGNTFEANVWTECLLARHASLVTGHVKSRSKTPHKLVTSQAIQATSILRSFRVWSEYRADRQNGPFFALTWVWKAYYELMSILVKNEIVAPLCESKAQQRIELQKAQTAVEAIILREASFPHANQDSFEIDSWVDQVISNWRAMIAPSWQDEDYGPGGNTALGKTVLDILYRSAMRSYHSTKILRHLFTVHAQLGEFNLASKSLDAYLELVAKGKARIEKSGESEGSLDNDATALCTAAAGIKMLCVYGKRADVERALQIADVLQVWLSKADDSSCVTGTNAKGKMKDSIDRQTKSQSSITGHAIALAYHAIGESQARWARLTYETALRSDLISKAISNFRTALKPDFKSQENLEILHSLAFAFAEVRDIDSAITTVKEAIAIGSAEDDTHLNGHFNQEENPHPAQRGTLLRCWHLLALLLSARSDYATAVASCEAAFDMIGGKAILYGDFSGLKLTKDLTLAERKALIELKLTQLALVEIISGPEEAVNSSGELLGLYAILFKYSEKEVKATSESNRDLNTSTTNSPQRSIRGSILGFPKDRRSKLVTGGTASSSVNSFEPFKQNASPPVIEITSDNAILPQNRKHHHNFLGRHESNKLKKRNSRRSLQGSLQRRSRAGSPLRPSTSDDSGRRLPVQGHASTEGHPDALSPFLAQDYGADEVGVAISHDMPSSPPTPASEHPNPVHDFNTVILHGHKTPILHKTPRRKPGPVSPETRAHLSISTLPEPRYPPLLQTRHALSLLAQIWCQISALYRRASFASDAQAAIREATTHVQAVEKAISIHEGSSMKSFSSPGYGNLKSLGELWADVQLETGALHVSLGHVAKASAAYELALGWCPNHTGAIVGLSNILLDSYETASSPGNHLSNLQPASSIGKERSTFPTQVAPTLAALPQASPLSTFSSGTELDNESAQHPDLAALSARDRAYKLLSTLTKSGSGWDNSDAWFALARAYELGAQEQKAKDTLWWVVELEEGRGIRSWKAADVV